MADPRIAGFLDANKKWAGSETYEEPVLFLDMQKRGREMEGGTVIVDPRVSPEAFLGIVDGSMPPATIVRTAGGRVTPALSTLYVLTAVGGEGKKGVVIVVHHTDCGLCHITDEGIKESLSKRTDKEEELREVSGMVFGSIEDPEKSVKEDVEILRNSSFFKGMQIVGMVQDTQTGLLKEVVGV